MQRRRAAAREGVRTLGALPLACVALVTRLVSLLALGVLAHGLAHDATRRTRRRAFVCFSLSLSRGLMCSRRLARRAFRFAFVGLPLSLAFGLVCRTCEHGGEHAGETVRPDNRADNSKAGSSTRGGTHTLRAAACAPRPRHARGGPARTRRGPPR